MTHLIHLIAWRNRFAPEYRDHSTAFIPRTGDEIAGVALQFDQGIEGVHAIQLAGVDQAHEQIADPRVVQNAAIRGQIDELTDRDPTMSLSTVPADYPDTGNEIWWAYQDLNLEPKHYELCALRIEI